MQYKVVNQPVEINGKTYPVDAVVDESVFKSPETHDVQEIENGVLVDKQIEWSEKESLLKTGHIVPIE